VENLTEKLLEDAYAFAGSFIKNRPMKRDEDVSMVEESKEGSGGAGVWKTESEYADTLRLYEINFDEVQVLIETLTKNMEESMLKAAFESLVMLFE
jgi:hypothetical protein